MKKLIFFTLLLSGLTVFSQNFNWVIRGQGTSVNALTLDKEGNMYTTGSFSGVTDFDPGVNVFNLNLSGTQTYIQKLDSLGNFIWANQFYCSNNSTGNDICTDKLGNTYVIGTGSTFSGNTMFILKFNILGNVLWQKQFIGASGNAIAIDSVGNIYTTGSFQNTVNFKPGIVPPYDLSSAGGEDVFVYKLDSLGNFLWAVRFGDAGPDMGYSLVIDKNQNILITGSFYYTVDFNPAVAFGSANIYNIASKGYSDIFVEKLDPSGNFIWAAGMGGAGNDGGKSIITDDNNNVYLTGTATGTCDFNPGPVTYNLTSSGYTDVCFEKLSSSGAFIWAKIEGGNYYDYPSRIFQDKTKSLYVIGNIESQSADMDPGVGINMINSSSTSGSYQNMFIQKLDTMGNLTWVTAIDKPVATDGAIGHSKNIVVVGFHAGIVDFNAGFGYDTLSTSTQEDFFLNLNQANCSNMTLIVDSVSNIKCLTSGYISLHAYGGTSPYSYSWNTTSTNSAISPVSPGIYSVLISDTNNCDRSVSFLINNMFSTTGTDLKCNLVTQSFVKGHVSQITLNAFNDGCAPVNGQLKLVLDTKLVFLNSNLLPSAITGDTIIWNFTNQIYDSLSITPQISVLTPSWTSTNDTIYLKTIITPTLGDVNPLNNIKDYFYRVRSAYDPNDKQVYPKGECDPGYILNNQLLTYTIRFQNTGTSNAINVVVEDSLNSGLNISSLRFVGSSHSVYTEVAHGNVLKFHFDNINLPDSTTNETLSNGYVIFEVMPVINLSPGYIIKNRVGIYFDFNTPVFTNNTSNTISTTIPISFLTVNASSVSVCSGVSTTLTAMGADTYTWLPTGTGANNIVSPSQATTYTVLGTTSNCINTPKTVIVNLKPLPVITVDADSLIMCLGDATIVTANGATTYTWLPVGSGNVVLINPVSSIIYTVTGTTNGCISLQKTILVRVNPIPIITLAPLTSTVCDNSSVTLNASGATSYTWYPTGAGSTNTVSPTATTIYTLTGTAAGCISSAVTSTVSFCDLTTDINLFENKNIKIYPNPTNGRLIIEFDKIESYVELDFVNVMGQSIQKITNANTDKLNIQLEGPSGIYFVKIITENNQYTSKIIKQ